MTILATNAYGSLTGAEEDHVVRFADLRTLPAVRRTLRRGELVAPATADAADEKPAPAILTKVLVPDAYLVSSLPFALARLRHVLREDHVDCLVTSSPPESMHLLGLMLGRDRPAWIAEFRDGWSFEPTRDPFPTAPQRWLDRRIERRVARCADLVVGVTKPIADDLKDRLGVRSQYVPNAWDPELGETAAADSHAPREGFTLVYTGSISGQRDPAPLLRALRIVRDEGVPVRLVIAGRLNTDDRRLIDEIAGDAVEAVGVLPRSEALALQRGADALVLLTSATKRSEATAKIFEYVGARRPIIALAQDNEAARIVGETGTGVSVPPGDAEAIVAVLRQLVDGSLAERISRRNVEQFTYPMPADAIEAAVEDAISRRLRH